MSLLFKLYNQTSNKNVTKRYQKANTNFNSKHKKLNKQQQINTIGSRKGYTG